MAGGMHSAQIRSITAPILYAIVLLVMSCVAFTPAMAKPRLFGTVEFQMELKKQKNWLSAMERNRKHPIFFDEKRFNASTAWKDLKHRAEGRPFLEKLNIVNTFWNHWPYRTDQEVYGQQDYWAAPYEFLAKSGDCEDYCIVKYYTLKELGISVDDMRIVIVREMIRHIGHAILAVYHGNDIYILDNLSDSVRSSERVRNYVPQFSVNEKYRWMHVKPK